MLLVYFVIAALPIGYLAGGQLGNIRYARLSWPILPCAAFMIEASFGLIGEVLDAPPSVWLGWAVSLEYLLLGIFIWLNRDLKGMKLLGAATLVNLDVIVANNFRMPVSPLVYDNPALATLVQRIQNGELPEYVLVDWDGPLWFLGDTIPIFGGLASIGDLMMALGILILLVNMMKTPKPRRRRRRRYSRPLD